MARQVDDAVQVRWSERAGTAGRPESFVWRGRLYRVGEVLGHWRRRRAWWLDPVEVAGAGSTVLPADLEEPVWRVEAQPGQSGGAGVYDLVLTPGRQWRLLRVQD